LRERARPAQISQRSSGATTAIPAAAVAAVTSAASLRREVDAGCGGSPVYQGGPPAWAPNADTPDVMSCPGRWWDSSGIRCAAVANKIL
jgi:hypothetical protein